ncbi:MAG TPA: DUF4352 domain-containing protein [Bryobacteraceae bacterium]|nr:DUF4352 domain-containing protein [Bryobacteraceae bacterium]
MGTCAMAVVALSCLCLAACTPERTVIRSYTIGERADAGLIIYTALEAVWRPQLGESAAPRLPQDRFLLVRLRITNSSPHETSVPVTTLVSSSGREYQELSDGEGVEDWLGVLRHLKPNETMFGWVVFDAPRGDYQLRVSDDAFDPADARLALIQLPLRLEAASEFLPDARKNR